MNIVTFVASSLLLALPLTSSAKIIEQKIPIQKHENIEIVAKQGVFSVSGWNEDFVNLSGQASDDIQLERTNTTLVLELNTADASSTHDQLVIKVPENKKISVTSDNAEFSFDGLNPRLAQTTQSTNNQTNKFDSDISVVSIDGNVNLRDSSGDFSINTINGDIAILNSRGVANIKSVSGNQNVDADFRNVSSSNVSGQSSYKLRTLEKLNLSNVNGNSSVESAISKSASVQMQSVNGNLSLLVPKTTSAKFSIQSHKGGSIRNTLEGVIDADSNDKAKTFSLADASASVTMNTMEGNIEVAPQTASVVEHVDEAFDWASVDTSILDFAYINPSHSVRDYKTIYIKPAEIHFDPLWEKRFGRKLSRTYRKRIINSYAKLLEKAIADKFSNDGRFKISDTRGKNVLTIIPKALDLYIDTPEPDEIAEVFVTTPAGNAQIDLVVYSPRDKSVLGVFMDKRSTTVPGVIQASNPRTVNSRAFSRLFNDWAEDIVTMLDK